MVQLDVTEVLVDPSLADTFQVWRRKETVSGYGRSSTSVLVLDAVGVITAATEDDLDRADDRQTMQRSIIVVSKFPLRGPAPGYQPDLILWNGDYYVVEKIDPYVRFGPGFVQAQAQEFDYVGEPPLTDQQQTGEMLFYERPANSAFIPIL